MTGADMYAVRGGPSADGRGFDVAAVRRDFPILAEEINGHPLVYLDNAATTQKPQCVIDTVEAYYRSRNANIHRGVHSLSEQATAAFEGVRETVRAFINAASAAEVIFTRGTTESINLVAQSYGRSRLKAGDEILIGESEHHSNIVPWQLLCEQIGSILKVAPINDAGEILLDEYERLLSEKTRLVAIGHVSNALGTINPVAEMTRLAHAAGAVVLVDGAQAVAHEKVDVRAIDCDFYAFSGHKIFGPTGIGVCYGKADLLAEMPPYQGGGDMIRVVTFERTEYNDVPHKFEAGTPHVAGVIGLGAALDYVGKLDLDAVARYEKHVLQYATDRLERVEGVRLIGTAAHKTSVLSFVIEGVHPHDLGMLLDSQGVAIRTGHHCAMPVMQRFGVAGTARASFALYNTCAEVDRFLDGLAKARRLLS
jgi:cysteine desulfurase/selenocysteine lyase